MGMTADNRLSLQQPGGRVADEKLSVPAVHAKHLKRLVAGLVADLQQVQPRLTAVVTRPERRLWAPKLAGSSAKRQAPAFTMSATVRAVRRWRRRWDSPILHPAEQRALMNAGRCPPRLHCLNRASDVAAGDRNPRTSARRRRRCAGCLLRTGQTQRVGTLYVEPSTIRGFGAVRSHCIKRNGSVWNRDG